VKRLALWLRTFLRHHRPALVGTLLVTSVVLTALVGPLLLSQTPDDVFARFTSPDAAHPFGTDSQGYDILARMVYGARTTLAIALAAMTMSLVLGSLLGAVAGFAGGRVDMTIMRLVDVAMSFPSFLLAMVTVAVLGAELENVIVAVGLVGAPMFARQVRAEVLRVVAADFVMAARSLGLEAPRILFVHVLPNSLGPIIVLGTLGMGSAILDVAGLNFLGLGGDPFRVPEWGLILTQGWNKRPDANLQVAVAGLAIFVTVLGFNLLGDGLKDELDPRTRRR
jgi:peptide/nickel transport system permease protein